MKGREVVLWVLVAVATLFLAVHSERQREKNIAAEVVRQLQALDGGR